MSQYHFAIKSCHKFLTSIIIIIIIRLALVSISYYIWKLANIVHTLDLIVDIFDAIILISLTLQRIFTRKKMKQRTVTRLMYLLTSALFMILFNYYVLIECIREDMVKQKIKPVYFLENSLSLTLTICKNTGDMMSVHPRNMRLSWKRQREQFAAMFASLFYFSKTYRLKVHLFTDSVESYIELLSTMSKWPATTRDRFLFEYHEIESERFLPGQLMQWRPCAWTKMFLPEMLAKIDSTLYVDSDVLFLGDISDSFSVFENMTGEVAIGAGAELWYVEEGNVRPAAGKYGINTGVMFMNLTRLRNSFGDLSLSQNLMAYKDLDPPPRHDQDVLNIFFKNHPEYLHELSARYNFLPSSCQKNAPSCTECIKHGILVLHGADSSFYRFVDDKMQVSI